MKTTSIIRTDRWALQVNSQQEELFHQTIAEYRRLVCALVGVVFVHWPQIASSKAQLRDVEKLLHKTAKNPAPRYNYFGAKFYKFPSYYRRAAINEAIGQVSSFVTRYDRWQSGQRSRKDATPPRLNRAIQSWPALYRGQCVKFDEGYNHAEVKVFTGSDWIWTKVEISRKRKRHEASVNKLKSPKLTIHGRRFCLAVPFDIPRKKHPLGDAVCSVDLGLNTAATASIVHQDGTVTTRKFINYAVDIDRRDKRLKRISQKARLTMGSGGKLSKGFCSTWYRKAKHINRNIAQHASKEVVAFARDNGCAVIVFEHLKGWRPKGGRRGSTLRQRFHGWLHRGIVNLTQEKFEEVGGRLSFVSPRYTSKLAFDGSGEVKRDKKNYSQAVFPSGKRYNADLAASYNIAAKFWHKKLAGGNDPKLSSGESSRGKPRMPVTLSVLWRVVDTPTTAAKAA